MRVACLLSIDTAPGRFRRTIVVFRLNPTGASAHLTWAMHGPLPYVAKVMHMVFNMDRMVGKDFETSLANLKAIAEKLDR